MDDGTAQHEIVRLEARIEALTEQLARCAKISLASKIAIGAGALWFVLALIGILTLDVTAFTGTVAALLGGVVLLGSNSTTWDQTDAALREAEAARAALIGTMRLRVVGEEARTLH
ncbi:MAG: hypothetical protein NTU64_03335 [Hyphomicrobiales bacterium]|nr:hypothetical protein [Hyphomicrobiales bacterium]